MIRRLPMLILLALASAGLALACEAATGPDSADRLPGKPSPTGCIGAACGDTVDYDADSPASDAGKG